MKRRILFFIKGACPNKLDKQNAEKLGEGVVFRNALFCDSSINPEDCDAVSATKPSDIPERYKKFPVAKPVWKQKEA